jgi:hypothetical protein
VIFLDVWLRNADEGIKLFSTEPPAADSGSYPLSADQTECRINLAVRIRKLGNQETWQGGRNGKISPFLLLFAVSVAAGFIARAECCKVKATPSSGFFSTKEATLRTVSRSRATVFLRWNRCSSRVFADE